MGQLKSKQKKGKIQSAAKPFCFDPEKFAKLSARLENISLNDIEGDSSLIFQDKIISKKVLIKILDYLDYKSLIDCQLVCKQWFLLIRDFIWQRHVKRLFCNPLPVNEKDLWAVFYALCDKKIPFGMNLIKVDGNMYCSDPVKGLICQWENIYGKVVVWEYTTKYFRAPKDDPLFDSNSKRIKIGGYKSWKRQIIYLDKAGFPQSILDNIKPIIKISEWYRCQRDSAGVYEFKVEFAKSEKTVGQKKVEYPLYEDDLIDAHHFIKTFENRNHRGTWRKFKYQLRNYEKGLNRIIVYHGGNGYIEIGATCVTLELPKYMNPVQNMKN